MYSYKQILGANYWILISQTNSTRSTLQYSVQLWSIFFSSDKQWKEFQKLVLKVPDFYLQFPYAEYGMSVSWYYQYIIIALCGYQNTNRTTFVYPCRGYISFVHKHNLIRNLERILLFGAPCKKTKTNWIKWINQSVIFLNMGIKLSMYEWIISNAFKKGIRPSKSR